MYTIGKPCNNLLKILIIPQVITLLVLAISHNNAGAQVQDKEEAVTMHAAVPGQWKSGVEGKWV
jgi:hypothetical protein